MRPGDVCPKCDREVPRTVEDWINQSILQRQKDVMIFGNAFWCEKCRVTFDPSKMIVADESYIRSK